MSDLVVSLDDRELRRAARAYARLGESVPAAIRDTLSEVAVDAQRRLAKEWDEAIEGGPARFTQISPGGKKGAVRDKRARRDGDGLKSSIDVSRLQSTYLKYALGEEKVREPGDAGAAGEYNFIFSGTRHQANTLGIKTDKHGNLPRNTLKKLVNAAKSQKERDREAAKKREKDMAAGKTPRSRTRAPGSSGSLQDASGRFVTRAALAAMSPAERSALIARNRRRTRAGRASTTGIFFGQLRRGRGPIGFWQRPPEETQKPSLLVVAVKKSTYNGDKLVAGWNRAVTQAAEGMPDSLQARLRFALRGQSVTQGL